MTPTDAVRAQKGVTGPTDHRPSRRGLVPAAVLAGALGALGATTLAGASGNQPVVTTGKVAGLGTVLVSSHRPLYEMVADPRGRSTCNGACTTVWIPLVVTHKAAHHLGHVSGLGTIRRNNGQLQVALHGHALYFFAGDHSLATAGGQGFGNNWFTVHANGKLNRTAKSAGTIVTTPPTTAPPGSNSASTTTRPTSSPSNSSKPSNPAPPAPAPTTNPPPTSPPTTTAPPPPPPPPPPTTTTTSPPPTTTTTTSGGGGGVGF